MEMTSTKRILLGLALAFVVVFSFIAGFMISRLKPSKRASNDAKEEILDLLDKYYYEDYDKSVFDIESLKAGVKSLGDPYTYLYSTDTKTSTGYYGYGFSSSDTDLGIKVNRVFDNSPAYNVGIKEGDIVIGVDSLTTAKDGINKVSDYLKEKNVEVTLHIIRNYNRYSVKISKANITVNLVESKKIGNIGYIKINEFDEGVSSKFKKALDDLEASSITGLVIDVRNNPGGLASEVASILRLFIDNKDPFLYLVDSKTNKEDVYRGTNAEKKIYDIKVLINENSASASEVFALAMNKVMNYDLIGTHTFGKNVFQSDFKLSSMENMCLHITLGYWYGANKEKITSDGINPTVEVENNYYIPMPINEETYEKDMADDEIKNIELMLKEMGYNTRTDGYFDDDLEFILTSNFEEYRLTQEVKQTIFNAYNEYVKNNDKVLNKALELLN